MAEDTKQRGRPRKIPLPENINELLTEQERSEIEIAARKELQAEQKSEAKKAYMQASLEKARRSMVPDEELRPITLDLAGHSDRITLDGVQFLHGATYYVTKPVYDTLTEIQQRGWEHESEVGGANRDAYRAPRGVRLRPGDEGRPIAGLMRV